MNLLIISILALAFSALIAGTETAFFALGPSQRKTLAASSDSKDRNIGTLLARPRQLLLTCLILNEAANLLFAATFIAWVLTRWGDAWLWAAVLGAGAALFAFSEALPKTLAMRYPLPYVHMTARPLTLAHTALGPVRWLLMGVGARLLNPLGLGPWTLPHQIEEEDLKHLINLGAKTGIFDKDERELIHNLFAFGDTQVSKLMTPRTEMIAFPVDTPLTSLMEGVQESRYARVPIYQGDSDHVIGILYTKDLLTLRVIEAFGPKRETPRPVEELLRKALYVPMTMKADELFRDFQTKGIHMAMVVDEYGGISGLITMDDLLGELFGEMLDELDADEPVAIRDLGDRRWEVKGHVEIQAFNAALRASLPEDERYATIAGYVLDQLGHLPAEGEIAEGHGWRFEVIAVTESRVETLRAAHSALPSGLGGQS